MHTSVSRTANVERTRCDVMRQFSTRSRAESNPLFLSRHKQNVGERHPPIVLGYPPMTTTRSFAALIAALLATPVVRQTTPQMRPPLIEDYVKASVTAAPASLGFDPFYKKYADALGIPI